MAGHAGAPGPPRVVSPRNGQLVNQQKGIYVRLSDFEFDPLARYFEWPRGALNAPPVVNAFMAATTVNDGTWANPTRLITTLPDAVPIVYASTATEGAVQRVDFTGATLPLAPSTAYFVKDVHVFLDVLIASGNAGPGTANVGVLVSYQGRVIGLWNVIELASTTIYIFEPLVVAAGLDRDKVTLADLYALLGDLEVAIIALQGTDGFATQWSARTIVLGVSYWDEVISPASNRYPDEQGSIQVQASDDGTFAGPDIVYDSGQLYLPAPGVVIPLGTLPADAEVWVRGQHWDDAVPKVASGFGPATRFRTMQASLAEVLVGKGSLRTFAEIWLRRPVHVLEWALDAVYTSVWKAPLSVADFPTSNMFVVDIEEQGRIGRYTERYRLADIVAAGEFFHDRANGFLYLRTKDDRDPGGFDEFGVTALIAWPVATEQIELPRVVGGIRRRYEKRIVALPGVSYSLTDFSEGNRATASGGLTLRNDDGVVSQMLMSEPVLVGVPGPDGVDGSVPYEEGVDLPHMSLHRARFFVKVLPLSLITAATWSDAIEIFSGELSLAGAQSDAPQVTVGVSGEDARLRNTFLAENTFTKKKYKGMRKSDVGMTHGEIVHNTSVWFVVPPVTNKANGYWLRPPVGTTIVGALVVDGTPIPSREYTFDGTHIKPVPDPGKPTLKPFINGNKSTFLARCSGTIAANAVESLLQRMGMVADVHYDAAGVLDWGPTSVYEYQVIARTKTAVLTAMAKVERTQQASVVRRSDGKVTVVDQFPGRQSFSVVNDIVSIPPPIGIYRHLYWERWTGLLTSISLVIRTEADLLQYPVKQWTTFENVAHLFTAEIPDGDADDPEATDLQTRRSWMARVAWNVENERKLDAALPNGVLVATDRLGFEPMIVPFRHAEFVLDRRGFVASPGELVLVTTLPHRFGDARAFDFDVFIVETQKLEREVEQVTLTTRWVGQIKDPKDRKHFR